MTDATSFEAEALSIWDGDQHDEYDTLHNAHILATRIYHARPIARAHNGNQPGLIYAFPDGSFRFVGNDGGEIMELSQ